MSSLKEQMNPSTSERALNVATLAAQKLQVLEARVSSQDSRFAGMVKDAATAVSSTTSSLIDQKLRNQNEYLLEMMADRVIDQRLERMSFWRKIKLLFGGRGW